MPQAYVAEALKAQVYADPVRDEAWQDLLRQRVLGDPAMADVDLHLEAMDEAETEIEVLSVVGPSVYFRDRGQSLAVSRRLNETLADIRRRHPTRFRALASVPLQCGDRGLEELSYALDPLGLDGVLLGSNIGGRYPDGAEFLPFFEEANRRGLLVLLHPMTPPAPELMREYNTLPIVGFLFDTTLCVTRLLFAGHFERFPRIQMVISHLGGAVPYLLGRMTRNYHLREALRKDLPHPPGHYLRTLYLDSICNDAAALAFAADKVGVDRILFGTDFPFVKAIRGAQEAVTEAPLAPEARQAIFRENALRLLTGKA
jgi:aminocarboxymuconate-semialdehyde decarboxylase